MASLGKPRVRPTDAKRVWQELLTGNRLFAAGARRHPRQSATRRAELTTGQHPSAVVIGCSDSRVPPELVFGCGLGDLFVIRTAGQVLDDAGLGSLEYAVEHLGVRLVVVLGHSNCGAVAAVVEAAPAAGHLSRLLERLGPVVAAVAGRPGAVLDNAVDENVRSEVARLQRLEPVLRGLVDSGKVLVVGARYDLRSGIVTQVK